jgi:hypothetical protein
MLGRPDAPVNIDHDRFAARFNAPFTAPFTAVFAAEMLDI